MACYRFSMVVWMSNHSLKTSEHVWCHCCCPSALNKMKAALQLLFPGPESLLQFIQCELAAAQWPLPLLGKMEGGKEGTNQPPTPGLSKHNSYYCHVGPQESGRQLYFRSFQTPTHSLRNAVVWLCDQRGAITETCSHHCYRTHDIIIKKKYEYRTNIKNDCITVPE